MTSLVHDRMPVLLGRQDHDAWLTDKAGVELLRPASNYLLRMWPVLKRVWPALRVLPAAGGALWHELN